MQVGATRGDVARTNAGLSPRRPSEQVVAEPGRRVRVLALADAVERAVSTTAPTAIAAAAIRQYRRS